MTIQQLNSLEASLQTIANTSEATLHRLNQDDRRLLVRISSTYQANTGNLANIAGTQDSTNLANVAGKLDSTNEQLVQHSSCIWRIIKVVLNFFHLRISATTAYTAARQLSGLIPPLQNREEYLRREAQKKEQELQEQEAVRQARKQEVDRLAQQQEEERREDREKRAKESKERVLEAQTSNQKNALLKLPENIHQTIASFLLEKDAASVVATCKSLAVPFKEAKAAEIALLIQCAKTLNDAIAKFPEGKRGLFQTDCSNGVYVFEEDYDSFYFDLQKWNSVLQNIALASATQAIEYAQECYLDLVEALAEYNVRTASDATDRIINTIELPEGIDCPDQQQRDLLSQIMDDAKHTLTGRVYLECDSWNGMLAATKVNNDWYSAVWLKNREHMTDTDSYDRFLNFCKHCKDQFWESRIKTELLRGKKQGDRIVLSLSQRGGKGDERVILRCSGALRSGYPVPASREDCPLFEEVLQESVGL